MRNQKEGFLKNINLHISKRQDKQNNNYYQNKNKTKTLFKLMKSSYSTYHNNKIEELNKTTLFTYHSL